MWDMSMIYGLVKKKKREREVLSGSHQGSSSSTCSDREKVSKCFTSSAGKPEGVAQKWLWCFFRQRLGLELRTG